MLCGDNKVWIIDKEKSSEKNIEIIWQWESSDVANQIPEEYQRYLRSMDECKFVDNNTKLLLASSSGGVLLIDRASKECLFYAYAPMAHSVEWLPNNRIAVALSTHPQGNSIEIYDLNQAEKALYKDSLYSGHGCVWIDKRDKLYALGFDELREYSLIDWETPKPKLHLDRTWKLPAEGGHDLSMISDTELLVSDHDGVNIFDIEKEEFQPFEPLATAKDIKSVNYNKQTKELIYTIAEESWWTFNIYLKNPDKVITIPEIKLYKVRTNPF